MKRLRVAYEREQKIGIGFQFKTQCFPDDYGGNLEES